MPEFIYDWLISIGNNLILKGLFAKKIESR